jgi:hypothetical protein
MRRFIGIFLFLVMTVFGTGMLQHVHMWRHEGGKADAACAEGGSDSGSAVIVAGAAGDSEEGCAVCRDLRAPMDGGIGIAGLSGSADTVEILAKVVLSQRGRDVPARLTCRGPPGC